MALKKKPLPETYLLKKIEEDHQKMTELGQRIAKNIQQRNEEMKEWKKKKAKHR
jgi:hypothetical protein